MDIAERTSRHTGLTTDTLLVIHFDCECILVARQSPARAYFHAGCFFALQAKHGDMNFIRERENPDPAHRGLIGFRRVYERTGDLAGTAADTTCRGYDQSLSHDPNYPLSSWFP